MTEAPLGAQLKTLLASRTVAFVGYSLTDPDLLAIVEAVTSEMNGPPARLLRRVA